jgi:hypothetical protein
MLKLNRSLSALSVLFFSGTLLMGSGVRRAIAMPPPQTQSQPTQVKQTSTPAEFPDSLYSYLDAKYTMELGQSRGACAYSIDPTEVTEQGSNRFVTVRISSGVGSGCRGVLEFVVLQADCQANKLYEIRREEIAQEPNYTGPPQYQLQQFERELTEYDGSQAIRTRTSEDLATQVCAFP